MTLNIHIFVDVYSVLGNKIRCGVGGNVDCSNMLSCCLYFLCADKLKYDLSVSTISSDYTASAGPWATLIDKWISCDAVSEESQIYFPLDTRHKQPSVALTKSTAEEAPLHQVPVLK